MSNEENVDSQLAGNANDDMELVGEKEGDAKATRRELAVISTLLAVVALLLDITLLKLNPTAGSSQILTLVFAVAAGGAVLFGVPWDQLGMDLKRFGFVEFDSKLQGMTFDRLKLEKELEELKAKFESVSKGASFKDVEKVDPYSKDAEAAREAHGQDEQEKKESSSKKEDLLKSELMNFLALYPRYSFSASRIKSMREDQSSGKGTSEIETQSVSKIRQALRDLVLKGEIETRISRKGNTLYITKKK